MLLLINQTVVILAAVVFTLVIILLVTMLVVAAQRLVNSGAVKLTINGEREVEVEAGGTLLGALQQANLFLPSACGGGGTCAMCKCQVHEGGEIYYLQKQVISSVRIRKITGDLLAK